MSRKVKFTPGEKIQAARTYLDGKESMSSIAKRLNVQISSVRKWIYKYETMGCDGFNTTRNKHYSKELNPRVSYYI